MKHHLDLKLMAAGAWENPNDLPILADYLEETTHQELATYIRFSQVYGEFEYSKVEELYFSPPSGGCVKFNSSNWRFRGVFSSHMYDECSLYTRRSCIMVDFPKRSLMRSTHLWSCRSIKFNQLADSTILPMIVLLARWHRLKPYRSHKFKALLDVLPDNLAQALNKEV